MTSETFAECRVDVVTKGHEVFDELRRNVLVEFDAHQRGGAPGTGRSSWADDAANATAARRCSGVSVGKLFSTCSKVSPSARLARTVRRGTRVPRKTGWPPQIFGFRSKASSNFTAGCMGDLRTVVKSGCTRTLGARTPSLNGVLGESKPEVRSSNPVTRAICSCTKLRPGIQGMETGSDFRGDSALDAVCSSWGSDAGWRMEKRARGRLAGSAGVEPPLGGFLHGDNGD
jgi:hypothetical protein